MRGLLLSLATPTPEGTSGLTHPERMAVCRGYLTEAVVFDGKATKPLQSGRERAGEINTRASLFSHPSVSYQCILLIKSSLYNLSQSAPCFRE